MTNAASLLEAATAWATALERVRDLKRQRAEHECERAEPSEQDDYGRYTYRGIGPCRDEYSADGEASWCEPCQRRERIHVYIPAAKKAERVARERLYRNALRMRCA